MMSIGRDFDIIHIQEGRKCNNKLGEPVDSVTPMEGFLKEAYGMSVLIHAENETIGAFQYITAYNSDRFEWVESKYRYFTKTPDAPTPRDFMTEAEVKEHCFGTSRADNESGCFINVLRDRASGEIVVSMNYHLSLPDRVRVESFRLMGDFAQEILKDYPGAVLYSAGDANTFKNNAATEEQLRLINEVQWNGAPIFREVETKFPDGNPATFTFVPSTCNIIIYDENYNLIDKKAEFEAIKSTEERKRAIDTAYDDPKTQAVTSVLDRVHVHPPEADVESVAMICPLYGAKIESLTNEGVKQAMQEARGKRVNLLASDHLPVVSRINTCISHVAS
jgi:hypothetical protein